jgi:hypothetical protein
MSTPSEPDRVKLVVASTYREIKILDQVMDLMSENYGKIDFIGDEYNFHFTDYYRDEMGEGLKKRIFSFRELIFPETIREIKWFTHKLEKRFSEENRRLINLDPGYITKDNFLLTTFKKSPHRIYIGDNVYAEIELIYENAEFSVLKWTYPDYRAKEVINNLNSIRGLYLSQLRSLRRNKDV